jgi:PAS domain S-box-containing protein
VDTDKRPAPADVPQAEQPRSAATDPASGPRDTPINILIVDDEPKNLTVLETVLDDKSYRLVRAESGDHALLALVAEEFALLILDIRMPGMTGFELAQTIRKRKKTARVPIIFLTAYYNEDQHVLEGYNTGAVDYLHKPINAPVLRSKVAVFAELYRKQRDAELANRALQAEVSERLRAEEQLRELNETLDQRVIERTEALREVEHFLQRITDVTPGMLHVFDLQQQRSVFVSQAVVSVLGYSKEEIQAMGREVMPTLIHPDDLPGWTEHMRHVRTLRDDQAADFEHRMRCKSGEYIWVHDRDTVFARDGAGAVQQVIGASFDVTERKRGEEALRESEERFRLLADNAPVLIWVNGVAGCEFVNRVYREYLGGLPEADVASYDAAQFVHADDRAGYVDAYRDCLSRRAPFEAQFRLRRHDGTYRWMKSSGVPRVTATGEFLGYIGITADIDDIKNAEEVARESERRKRLATEATGVGIWEWNVKTNQVLWDDQMFRLYGVAPTDDGFVDYTTWSAAVLPEDLPRQEEVLQETVRRRGHSSREFRIQRADDGECRHLQAVETVRLDAKGDTEWVVGTNLDVTGRKRIEELVRESEERFRTLAEGMPHCVWVCDRAGSIEYQNRAWYEYTGMSPGLGHGLDLLDFYHPDDRPQALEDWKTALRTDAAYDIDVRMRRWDGEYRWFRVLGSPIKDAGGTTVRWAGTCSDIHQQRLLLEALIDADRRKDEFLATLAHELRNPLAPLRNAVQILQLKGSAIPELQWARDIIDRQTQHLTRLIDDLMDVSRISRGKIELKREHVELERVVLAAIETSRPLIEECGHELSVTLPSSPVIVDADLTRLAQVFLNLLNNAAKYTERAGRIDLRAERHGSEVVVSVRDTGIGIPPDNLPSIFEMFSQLEGALSRSQGGLGIGLFLVKRLVQMHGGTIEAHSEGRGRGTEFVVRLPIVVEHDDASQVIEGVAHAGPTSGLRILVADDNRDAASTLTMVLKLMGNTVHTVYDGENVVVAAAAFRPHVVLCDIGMPRMNGYEACRLIRQETWGKDMLLIAVTGWGREDDKRQAEEAGFDRHMVKPVEPQGLMRMLAGLNLAQGPSKPTA